MKINKYSNKRIKVVIRYDDFSALSNYAVEMAVMDVLRSHGLRAVFGVIPFAVPVGSYDLQEGVALEGVKAQSLREAVEQGFVEAALHGCRHLYQPRFDYANGFTEFEGLSCSEQYELISIGKAELERVCGCKPRCFIPPFNSYDECTLVALRENEIECLSAAIFDPVPDHAQVLLLPHTCNIPQLKNAVELARLGSSSDSIVTVLFHAFDFWESGQERAVVSLSEFESLAAWIASQQDVDVMTISQVIDTGADLSLGRYQSNRKLRKLSLHPLSPSSEYARRSRTYYPGTFESRSLITKVRLKSLEVYTFAMVAGILTGGSVAVMSGLSANTTMWVFVVCNLVWFVFLYWRRRAIYAKAALMSVFMISSAVGGMLS